jgi:hypothetical protein
MRRRRRVEKKNSSSKDNDNKVVPSLFSSSPSSLPSSSRQRRSVAKTTTRDRESDNYNYDECWPLLTGTPESPDVQVTLLAATYYSEEELANYGIYGQPLLYYPWVDVILHDSMEDDAMPQCVDGVTSDEEEPDTYTDVVYVSQTTMSIDADSLTEEELSILEDIVFDILVETGDYDGILRESVSAGISNRRRRHRALLAIQAWVRTEFTDAASAATAGSTLLTASSDGSLNSMLSAAGFPYSAEVLYSYTSSYDQANVDSGGSSGDDNGGSSSSGSSSSSSGGTSMGLIAGAVGGGVAVLVAIIIAAVIVNSKKKKRAALLAAGTAATPAGLGGPSQPSAPGGFPVPMKPGDVQSHALAPAVQPSAPTIGNAAAAAAGTQYGQYVCTIDGPNVTTVVVGPDGQAEGIGIPVSAQAALDAVADLQQQQAAAKGPKV